MHNIPRIAWALMFLPVLLMHSCVPTDTRHANPHERMFVDVQIQWNGGDLRSEGRFYVEDSLGRRPYFLQTPLFVNGAEMEKKLAGEKGVYYLSRQQSPLMREIPFRYTSLDGSERTLPIPMGTMQWTPPATSFTKKTLLDWPLDSNQTLVIVDAGKRLFQLRHDSDTAALDGMARGKTYLVSVRTLKGERHIKDKRWLRYRTKVLSEMTEGKMMR